MPRISRWASAQEAVALSRLRLGEVRRGPFVRDVSVEGRLRAAEHPTLYAPVAGIVAIDVREGEVVATDQVLAILESPELRNRSEQEASRLQALGSELGRLRITARENSASLR